MGASSLGKDWLEWFWFCLCWHKHWEQLYEKHGLSDAVWDVWVVMKLPPFEHQCAHTEFWRPVAKQIVAVVRERILWTSAWILSQNMSCSTGRGNQKLKRLSLCRIKKDFCECWMARLGTCTEALKYYSWPDTHHRLFGGFPQVKWVCMLCAEQVHGVWHVLARGVFLTHFR